MHDRNIYKIRPNFSQLAERFGFFAPFVRVDDKGNAKINFKDPNALRALSKALLLQDFGLDVEIPENTLIPTVPLRLNYILWIEDLIRGALQGQGIQSEPEGAHIRGIDIGTGATVVYALLGARKNGWSMVGTEVDKESAKIARDNVIKNNLAGQVTIVECEPKTSILIPILSQVTDSYYFFTMCNPPFFASDDETDSVRKGRYSQNDEPLRPPPFAAKTGHSTELVAEGGELQFVQGLIQDSLRHQKKVLIYTTMLGIKRHIKQLISYLRSNNVANYTMTEFTQGKTMRWGLAWSFCVNLLPPNPDLVASFQNISTLINFEQLIASYLSDLKFHTMSWLSTSPDDADDALQRVLEIVATENTWSNQRRKRRLEKRLQEEPKGNGEGPSSKVQKSQSESDPTVDQAAASSSPSVSTPKSILLHCFIDFEREGDRTVNILMRFRDGTLGKEGVHQILQYIKNRYDKDSKDPSNLAYNLTELK